MPNARSVLNDKYWFPIGKEEDGYTLLPNTKNPDLGDPKSILTGGPVTYAFDAKFELKGGNGGVGERSAISGGYYIIGGNDWDKDKKRFKETLFWHYFEYSVDWAIDTRLGADIILGYIEGSVFASDCDLNGDYNDFSRIGDTAKPKVTKDRIWAWNGATKESVNTEILSWTNWYVDNATPTQDADTIIASPSLIFPTGKVTSYWTPPSGINPNTFGLVFYKDARATESMTQYSPPLYMTGTASVIPDISVTARHDGMFAHNLFVVTQNNEITLHNRPYLPDRKETAPDTITSFFGAAGVTKKNVTDGDVLITASGGSPVSKTPAKTSLPAWKGCPLLLWVEGTTLYISTITDPWGTDVEGGGEPVALAENIAYPVALETSKALWIFYWKQEISGDKKRGVIYAQVSLDAGKTFCKEAAFFPDPTDIVMDIPKQAFDVTSTEGGNLVLAYIGNIADVTSPAYALWKKAQDVYAKAVKDYEQAEADYTKNAAAFPTTIVEWQKRLDAATAIYNKATETYHAAETAYNAAAAIERAKATNTDPNDKDAPKTELKVEIIKPDLTRFSLPVVTEETQNG